MSDHKRVGLPRAFSPSGLSGSNIHLAWCIPGLETLMWFVGKSRWQVHGSTLLTDSAGASGRLHNNTECLSLPPPSPNSPSLRHTTNMSTYFPFFDICVLLLEDFRSNHLKCWHSAQHYQPCNLLFSTLLLCLDFCLFSPSAPLSAFLLCLFAHLLLSYFITLTPTHTTRIPVPLDSPPITPWLSFTPSITLLIPLSSPLLLSSTFSRWACIQVLEISCLVLPLQSRNDVMQ